MTVHELRYRLSQLEGSAQVAVLWEEYSESKTHIETRLFEIDHVSMSRGTPSRDEEGRGGFTFDGTGPASWLFISVIPAQRTGSKR
jgi:hypothetical protein